MSPYTRMILLALADFFLAAGGALAGAMVQEGRVMLPDTAVLVLAFILGGVAFWGYIKAALVENMKKAKE